MRLLINERTRVISLVSKDHALLFHTSDDGKVRIELSDRSSFNPQHFKQLSVRYPKIHGFLGLIQIEDGIFLCVITGKTEMAQPLPHQTVNKIHGVEFHCLNKNNWDGLDIDNSGYPAVSNESDQQYQQVDQHPCHELRKLLSNGSFYYSSNFDLTSNLQKRGVGSNSLSFDLFEHEYMWNSFMMDEMISFRNKLGTREKQVLDDNGFLTTVIRGFAETFKTHIRSTPTLLTMISKQSCKRAGTRFNARGIDDDGNVANFVETEFILFCSKIVYSFTEIRGSVPVFWEQDTALISPKVSVTRSQEATQPIFDKHFQRLFEKYGAIHVVNLLSTKPNEIDLSRRYRSHIKTLRNSTQEIMLTEFDFHQEAGKNFEMASKIIPMLAASFKEFRYYSYDLVNNEVLSEQMGTFRTNCLDCLDRTNVIQQVISSAMLNLFFRDNNIQMSNDMDLMVKGNTLWADQGDAISQIYTGTNALKSSFSRSGKMGFAGLISDATKSVSRMYINNFVDKSKQQTIDMLLGKLEGQIKVQLYDPVNDYVLQELDKYSSSFTTHGDIVLFTGTYNLAGTSKVGDLRDWLFPLKNNGSLFSPDVLVLGFQEVVELNAGNILNSDKSQSIYWQNLVLDQLNSTSQQPYVLLRAEQMASLMLLFFVRKDRMPKIKLVEGSTKKTGLGGMTANKGGVAIRFDYGDTSFCVVNSHLAAGNTNVMERANDYNTIYNGITFTRGKKIKDHESIIWLGDLNFRIDMDNEEVRNKIELLQFHSMIQHDQLKREMNTRGGAFHPFKEMLIDFKPTYKFDKGTNVYDSSEKQRTPSWTDRVVYQGKNLIQLNYDSVETIMFSDHKPVFGTFKANVKFIDQAIRHKIKDELYEKYKGSHKDESSSLIDLDDSSSMMSSSRNSLMASSSSSSEEKPPLLPSRTSTVSSIGSQGLPPQPPTPRRRVPPAPTAGFSDPPLLPQRPSQVSNASLRAQASPPPPPQLRKVASPPIGFSNVPLMPTRSSSSTPVSVPNQSISRSPTVENKASPHQGKLAPIVPKKPSALSIHNLNQDSEKAESVTSNVMSMSDWKPLQPN